MTIPKPDMTCGACGRQPEEHTRVGDVLKCPTPVLTKERISDNALRQWADNFAGQAPAHPVYVLLMELLERRAAEPRADRLQRAESLLRLMLDDDGLGTRGEVREFLGMSELQTGEKSDE